MMKFNFRKIASVLASTVMLSSTVALAAAATLPSPFVQDGKGSALIVTGSNPLASADDVVAATNIKSFLDNKVTVISGPTSTTTPTSVTGGDSVLLAKNRTNNFNLGDRMNTFYSSMDSDQLSVVLADGTYENDNNDEFDYEQKITLGGNQLGFQQDDDFNDEKPFIGFDMTQGAAILNYTLDFTTNDAEGGTGFADLEDTTIDMLGRTYYISDAATTANGVKLTLLDNANKQTVYSDDPITVTVGTQSFDVELVSVDEGESSSDAVLKINGKNVEVSEGGSKKIGEDTYVSVMKVNEASREADRHYVEFSIGTGQIILENNQEVKMNNEQLSDLDQWEDHLLKAYIVNASTDISSLTLQWTLKDDAWLTTGKELVLPGFSTIKLSMGGFVTPMEEVTTVENSGTTRLELDTEVTDGKVTLPLLFFNDSAILAVGKDAGNRLKTSATSTITLDEDDDSYFVLSRYNGDDYESYVMEIGSIKTGSASNGKNTTTIKSVAKDSNVGAEIDIGETEEVGDISVTLNSADESTGAVSLTIAGSGTVSASKLITKEGLLIHLPIAAANGTSDTAYQYVNVAGLTVSGAPSSTYVMNFTEEDKDGDIAEGSPFSVTLGLNGDNDAAVTAVSVTDYELGEESDDFEGYVISDLATKTLYKTGSDQDTVEITYHGEESFAEVYLSEASAVITGGEGGEEVTQSGIMVVKDTEVTSTTNANLVVVGGSCVNKVAAELLGLTYGEDTSCGQAWQTKTNVGAGSYLIQSFARNGKIATLVAGYNAGDTTNAAAAFRSQSIDTTAGKKYTGTTGSTVTLVTSS